MYVLDYGSATYQSVHRQIYKHCSLQMHYPRCPSLELQRQWAGLEGEVVYQTLFACIHMWLST